MRVDAREKTYRRLLAHRIRLAAFPGEEPDQNAPPTGKRPDMGATQRQIPGDHDFDPRALKPLAETMWSLSVALGHLLTAHRQFSRLKSVSFSPDGLVGGRGYVMTVKDIRSRLFEASDHISGICDTLFDEINAPHWKPKLAELEAEDVDDVVKLIDDTQDNLDDPEGEADEDMAAVEGGPRKGPEAFGGGEEEESSSEIPDNEDATGQSKPFMPKTASLGWGDEPAYSYERTANSSLPVSVVPGGPRVDHLDPADHQGPGDSYNQDEPPVDDDYGLRTRWADSALPKEYTPTDAFDFGIGYGAHGKGIDADPGDRSALPGDYDGNSAEWDDAAELQEPMGDKEARSTLPNDGEKPVARADYYEGFKDNDIDKGARADLPGVDTTWRDVDYDSMDTGYTYERQGPMVVYDDSTHDDKPDPLYSRRPE